MANGDQLPTELPTHHHALDWPLHDLGLLLILVLMVVPIATAAVRRIPGGAWATVLALYGFGFVSYGYLARAIAEPAAFLALAVAMCVAGLAKR